MAIQLWAGEKKQGICWEKIQLFWVEILVFYLEKWEADLSLQLVFWQALAAERIAVQAERCFWANDASVHACMGTPAQMRSWEVGIIFCCCFNHQELECLFTVMGLCAPLKPNYGRKNEVSFVRLHLDYTAWFDELEPFGFSDFSADWCVTLRFLTWFIPCNQFSMEDFFRIFLELVELAVF